MNKKIIGKHRYSKEEKEEMQRKELEKKDLYMLQNAGGYKRIFPSGDPAVQLQYEQILDTIRE